LTNLRKALLKILILNMHIPSKYLEKATEQIATLPGIGKRTALRLALHMHQKSIDDIHAFIESIVQLKSHTFQCSSCGNLADTTICSICTDPKRNPKLICVVEDIRDVMAIESTQTYKGHYHVLGGVISPMDGIGPQDLNIEGLVEKANKNELEEVIFALSPNMEGDTTHFYLFKKIQREGLLITTLSRGVSVGTEIQYADELTLGRSLQQRLEFKLTF